LGLHARLGLAATRADIRAQAVAFGVAVAIVVSACAQSAPPSTASAAPPAIASRMPSAVASSAGPTVGPAASASPATAASPAAELLPIGGTWRVRRVLATQDRVGLIADRMFADEAYEITPDCDQEPCLGLEVRATPLGYGEPVAMTTLRRSDATYTSTDEATTSAGCITPTGDRVAGGATARSRLSLWMTTDRATGTAVSMQALHGTIEVTLAPTSIGEAAGCEPRTVVFTLTGQREDVAVNDPSSEIPQVEPPAGAAQTNLPRLTATVSGATVDYFAVRGDTSVELAVSVAIGGGSACGSIDYEWVRGDARPSACTLTSLTDVRNAIRYAVAADGSCRITRADFKIAFTVYMPRWTSPARVPSRLVDWWRRIIDFIADHEAGHVRIGRDYIRKLNARLAGVNCDDAGGIIRTWASQHSKAQEAYDRTEYAKPWPQPAPGY
jgi:predicted secreted Zn-dependent protease